MTSQRVCALCTEFRPLVDSHALPEFLYEDVYDVGHFFHVHSSVPGSRPMKRRKGIYEPLLCRQCDRDHLGKLDDYAAKVFKGGLALEFSQTEEFLIFKGLQYQKFKLWQMSLLWRCGMATRSEFHLAKLGPHEERIRQMLLRGDPGQPHEYGCVVVIPASFDITKQLVIPPEPVRLYGQRCYRATFGGLWWIYVVSAHSAQFERHEGFLTADGTWRIVKDGSHSTKFLLRRAADTGILTTE